MAILNEVGEMKEAVLAAKGVMDEVVAHGEELVLLIPYGTWINYPPKTWEVHGGAWHISLDFRYKDGGYSAPCDSFEEAIRRIESWIERHK